MQLELNIGELQIDGLVGVHESVLQPAIQEAMQLWLFQRNFSEMKLTANSIHLEEVSFQMDADSSVKKMANQIAEGIMQKLTDTLNNELRSKRYAI